MKAKVLFASVRLLLSLVFLIGLVPVGLSPVQASALEGTIAYVVGNQPDGDEIHLIEPDGSGDRVLFRTNNPLPENFADIMSLAWKPDASELAFASGHEYLCSLYNMDIYAIRANGEDYRRVTDPPACGARAGLPTGTVIVPVFNANTYPGPFFIYFEGAPSAQAISLASGSTKMVTFENVADYGDVEQSAVYITKDGRYTYAGAHLNVIPGETLTTNTVNMATGVEHFGWYWPSYLQDGSKISSIFTGHSVFTFESNNYQPGWHGDEKLNFNFLMSGSELSWGPTPELANKFLYWGDWRDSSYYMHGSIFLGDITDGSKKMLVDADPKQNGDILLGYSWLPDGSGFLYSHKQMIIIWEPNFSLYEVSNIWEYSFATGVSKRISNVPNYTWIHQLSVSPDGSKIVYEYQPTGDWINRAPLELWIMNRDGSDQHRLVTNGRNPAWSPAEIPDMKPVPALNSITPVSATGGGAAFTLTATGSSFVQGAVVRWNGADLATTFGNATTLTAEVPADKIAAAGTANVTVFNPGPGGGTSMAKTFTINPAVNNNPVPTATNLDPAVVDAGAPAFPLTVSGSSFISNSVVRWNGASLPTTFVNATTLTAQVTADKIAQTGPVSVTVFTPAPGGGESNALTLSIINPAPVLSGISPNAVTAGGPNFILTVSGSKFVNGSVVCWNGIDLITTYVDATQLTAQVPANTIAVAGTASVTVYNPAPGGGTSASGSLVINNPIPVLASIDPVAADAGGSSFTLAVSGSNFVSGAKVRWNGIDLTTTYVNATTLTAQVPAAKITSAGTASVTVFNPIPGGGVSEAKVFTINQSVSNNPLPVLTGLTPDSKYAGGTGFTLTITGSNFVSASVVRWNGVGLVTTFVNATTLTVQVPAEKLKPAGAALVTVYTPEPGGGVSAALAFTVNQPPHAVFLPVVVH